MVFKKAGMAQEVAHFIGNEEVTGSTPVASFIRTKLRGVTFKVAPLISFMRANLTAKYSWTQHI